MLYNYAGRVGFPSNPALGLNHSTFEATNGEAYLCPVNIYIFFNVSLSLDYYRSSVEHDLSFVF